MYVSLIGEDKDEVTKLVNAVVDTYLAKVVDHKHEDRVGHCNKLDDLRRERDRSARPVEQPAATGRAGRRHRGRKALSIRRQVWSRSTRSMADGAGAVREDARDERIEDGAGPLGKRRRGGAYGVRGERGRLADAQAQQLIGRLTSYRLIIEDLKRTMVPGSKMGAAKRQMMEAEMQQQYDQLGKEIRGQLKKRKHAEAEREVEKLETQVPLLTEQEQALSGRRGEAGKGSLARRPEMMESEWTRTSCGISTRLVASIAGEREKLKVELNSTPRIVRLQKAESPKEEYKRRDADAADRRVFPVRLLPAGVRRGALGRASRGASTPSRRWPRAGAVGDRLGAGESCPNPAAVGRQRQAHPDVAAAVDRIDRRHCGPAAPQGGNGTSEGGLRVSAVAGEGKTAPGHPDWPRPAPAICRRTVLVDFDLRAAGPGRGFRVPLGPGIEALRGNANVNGMVHPTGTEHLSVLSAGQCDRRAMAALANGGAAAVQPTSREV